MLETLDLTGGRGVPAVARFFIPVFGTATFHGLKA